MLAIIGGTGLYALDGIEPVEEIAADTPFGKPSAPILKARRGGQEILFLPRHGKHHDFLPHEVNYRANIHALKALGARQVIGVSAVGSLRQQIAPGDFAVPAQYFDWVKGSRVKSFFGQGLVAHISGAEPSCKALTATIASAAAGLGETLHTGVTYACVDGPRLGTRAESHFLRGAGCDLVGMTNVPEAFLAREAQLCYAVIAIATDYDCWLEDPSQHVTVAQVIERYGQSLGRVRALLNRILDDGLPTPDGCRQGLKDAILTPPDAIPPQGRELLSVLSA